MRARAIASRSRRLVAQVARALREVGFDPHARRRDARDADDVLGAQLEAVERLRHGGARRRQVTATPMKLGPERAVFADPLWLG